jgi:hypothetical protein
MVKLFNLASLLVLALSLGLGTARAQQNQTVSSSDIQRLQDALADATRDLSGARVRDAALASRLETELDNLRDEVAYLRVKLRRSEPVARSEYFDLRDRIDELRARARGENARPGSSGSGSTTASSTRGSTLDIPAGTEFDVRLSQSLSSSTNLAEDRFEATTLVDLREGDNILVPAGSVMRGVVSSVTKTSRTERTGRLTLAFDQITIGRRPYPIRATVTQAIESEGIKGEAGRIGAGAGVGAIIGGILGGVKGAIAGILIGGGGTVAATEGKDVDLPAGTVLRVRLDSGLNLR